MDIKSPENLTVVDSYSLASPFERILAFLIDFLVYVLLYIFLYAAFWIIGISWFGGVLAGLYLILKDNFKQLKYQSIGKKIMKLKVINSKDELKISAMAAFKRNFVFIPSLLNAIGIAFMYGAGTITVILILIELYLMYTNSDYQRLGDQFADTLVIEKSV